MKTSYKAFAFAILAAFVVALAVVPADDSSAATTAEPQMLNADDGTTWVRIVFDSEISSPLTFSVYNSSLEQVASVEQPNTSRAGTTYTFKLGTNLSDLGTATYYMSVVVGGQTLYSNVPDTPAPTPEPGTTYDVTVAASENGSVTAAPTAAAEGASVTLTITPATGYELDSLTVDGSVVDVTGTSYTFAMPAHDVAVSATFKQSETPGPTPEPPATEEYAITIASDIQNGTVTADKATAKAGEVISLTAEPATGYVLDAYSVTLAGGQSVAVDNGTFTMPSEAVTVSATFKQSETPGPTPVDPEQEYTITVSDTEGGDVTASASSAKAGEKVTLTIKADAGYSLSAVTVNGTAISASRTAADIAAAFVGTTDAYGKFAVQDGATADSAVIVHTYTTTQSKTSTHNIVISSSADYSALAAEITGDSKYTIVDTSSINGAAVTAGYRAMGAAYLVKIAASADGYVANAVDIDGSSTYVYVLGPTADTIAAEVLSIAQELSAALVNGSYSFEMPAQDTTVAASFIEYKTASLSGDVKTKDTVFDQYQIVNITADTTLVSGAGVTINGQLVVPAGVTLTIQAGAYLVVTGTANIAGNVVIEAADAENSLAPGALIAYNGGVITLAGTVTVDGVLGSMNNQAAASIVVAQGSDVQVQEDGAVTGTVVIASGASMTVSGSFGYAGYAASFKVAGTLTVDTEAQSAPFDAVLTAEGASVVISSITYGTEIESGVSAGVDAATITVTDATGSSVVITTSLTKSGEDPADANDYPVNALAVLSGITVSEGARTIVLSGAVDAQADVSYFGLGEQPEYTLAVAVAVSGTSSIAASSIGENAVLTVSGTSTVDADLALANGVSLTSSAALNVKAAVDATATGSAVVNNGVLTVSGQGSITATTAIANLTSATYNGAYYTVGKAADTVYHYVTVDAALTALQDGTTDRVSLYGAQTVTGDYTIANGDRLTLEDGATLTIGAKSGDDVTLTVAKGGSITLANPVEKQITVNGTLHADVYRNVSKIRANIDSDVYSYALNDKNRQDNDSWAEWTNVYNALDKAVSGQTVILQKDVTLTKDAEVKEGVTLDADSHAVAVGNDAALTVTGTLDLTDASAKLTLADAAKATRTDAAKAAGAVVVSGYIRYTDDAQVPVLSGAYYTQKNVKVLTTYVQGLADVLKADDTTVTLKAVTGAVALTDASVSGNADSTATVLVDGDLTGSITLAYAELFVNPGYKIDATFAGNGGTIVAKGQAGTSTLTVGERTYTFGFNVTDAAYSGAEVIGFGGTLEDYTTGTDGKTKVDTALTVSASVYAMSYMDISVDAFTIAGTLTVTGEDGQTGIAGAKAGATDVQGSLVVAAGSDLTVTDLTVSGAVAVQNGALAATKAVVTGSVDASAVDADKNSVASFTAGVLYIGTDGKQFTGADASVTGNVAVTDYALAAPGATVADTLKASPYVQTAYTVNGSEYLNAYGVEANSLKIADVKYSQENAKFLGWKGTDTIATTEVVGAEGFTSVAASIDTAIYTVQITTDGGINYITIGGKLLTNTSGNVFSISGLAYGSDLTLVFQGKAGYDTTGVKLYDAQGNASGVALPSAQDYTVVSYQLIGSTPSASTSGQTTTIDVSGIIKAIEDNTQEIRNKDVNVNVDNKSDDDNGLTNILLVVLVILILVMAILVAYRMMRS